MTSSPRHTEQIKHFAAGGETFTVWRILPAGLICLIVTVLVAVILITIVFGGGPY